MNKPETSDCRPTYVERLDRLIKPMTKTAEGLSDEQWNDYDRIRALCEAEDKNYRMLDKMWEQGVEHLDDVLADLDDYSDLREPMQ